MADPPPGRRASARARLECTVTLSRVRGGAIAARTVDLGEAGARVRCERPLRVDEVLGFDLDLDLPRALHVHGEVRVLREDGWGTYALRFEQLPDETTAALMSFVGTRA
jgi:hypothetical protein